MSAGAVWHCCSVWEVLCSLAPPALAREAFLHLGNARGATLLQPTATESAVAAPATKACRRQSRSVASSAVRRGIRWLPLQEPERRAACNRQEEGTSSISKLGCLIACV